MIWNGGGNLSVSQEGCSMSSVNGILCYITLLYARVSGASKGRIPYRAGISYVKID